MTSPRVYQNRMRFDLCVDELSVGRMSGRCYSAGGMRVFGDISDLLLSIENSADASPTAPQATVEHRSFKPVHNQNAEHYKPGSPVEADVSDTPRGEKATFIVQLISRRQATWQGTVSWVEGGVTRDFKSELELLKMIDGAVGR